MKNLLYFILTAITIVSCTNSEKYFSSSENEYYKQSAEYRSMNSKYLDKAYVDISKGKYMLPLTPIQDKFATVKYFEDSVDVWADEIAKTKYKIDVNKYWKYWTSQCYPDDNQLIINPAPISLFGKFSSTLYDSYYDSYIEYIKTEIYLSSKYREAKYNAGIYRDSLRQSILDTAALTRIINLQTIKKDITLNELFDYYNLATVEQYLKEILNLNICNKNIGIQISIDILKDIINARGCYYSYYDSESNNLDLTMLSSRIVFVVNDNKDMPRELKKYMLKEADAILYNIDPLKFILDKQKEQLVEY